MIFLSIETRHQSSLNIPGIPEVLMMEEDDTVSLFMNDQCKFVVYPGYLLGIDSNASEVAFSFGRNLYDEAKRRNDEQPINIRNGQAGTLLVL